MLEFNHKLLFDNNICLMKCTVIIVISRMLYEMLHVIE